MSVIRGPAFGLLRRSGIALDTATLLREELEREGLTEAQRMDILHMLTQLALRQPAKRRKNPSKKRIKKPVIVKEIPMPEIKTDWGGKL